MCSSLLDSCSSEFLYRLVKTYLRKIAREISNGDLQNDAVIVIVLSTRWSVDEI